MTNQFFIVLILIGILAYIVFTSFYIVKLVKNRRAVHAIDYVRKEHIKTFNYEKKLLEKFKLDPDKMKLLLYIGRVAVAAILVALFIAFKGLAFTFIASIAIVIFMNDAYANVVYKANINNVPRVNNFINNFVPLVTSGRSSDQAFLSYIEYAGDEELLEYFENKDDPEYKMHPHIRQIVDIYDIARYNEEQGVSGYTYIMEEIAKDLAQKGIYYNSFISRVGEIKPIIWSYYIAVPLLIAVSFSTTKTFWFGFGGYIVGFILVAFFGTFKYLIFRLQKNTIESIF